MEIMIRFKGKGQFIEKDTFFPLNLYSQYKLELAYFKAIAYNIYYLFS